MNPLYFFVAERAHHRCEYCRTPESIFNVVFEVEHIIPVTAGGTSTEDNLALACRSCNSFKGSRSILIQSLVQKKDFIIPGEIDGKSIFW